MQENPWIKSLPFLWLMVASLMALELGARFQIPILDFGTKTDAIASTVLADVRTGLPQMVTTIIGDQIQELAMDRIKLDQTVIQATRHLHDEPIVLKVGERKLSQTEFLDGLNRLAQDPANAGQSREDLKEKLVNELHRHLAIVQDAEGKKLDRQEEFRSRLNTLELQTFLGLLLKRGLTPPTEEEKLAWYDANQNLFSQGDLFHFAYLSAATAEELVSISQVDALKSSPGLQSVTQAMESAVPYIFARTLRSMETGSLSAVLRHQNRFHILLKTADVTRQITPYEQVRSVVESEMMWKMTRDYIARTSNPFRFQFELNSQELIVDGENMKSRVDTILPATLPKWFLERLNQSPADLRSAREDIALILAKYERNPLHFGKDMHEAVLRHTRALREVLLTQDMQNLLLSQTPPPSEEELKQIYDANPDRFVQARGDLTHHIFIRDRTRALDILNRVLMDPGHFSDLARVLSEEPLSKPHGGDMRYLPRTSITEEMNRTVESLSDGQISQNLIPGAQGGFHILKLIQKDAPLRVASFEEIKPRLKEAINRQRQQETLKNYISDVMGRYALDVDQRILNTL